MAEHEWTDDKGRRWKIEGEDNRTTDYGFPGEAMVPTAAGSDIIARELLRLAEEVERLKAVSMATVGDLDVCEEIVRLMERWDAEGDDDPLWRQALEFDWSLPCFLGVGLTEALRAAGTTERERLRPLLERCLSLAIDLNCTTSSRMAVALDLRRELRLETTS